MAEQARQVMKARLPRLRQAQLSPFATLAVALLAGTMLGLAIADKQFDIVAGYTYGTSVASITAVLASGGSTLTFLTGDSVRRASIRLFRTRFTTPVLIVAALLTAAYVHYFSYLSPWDAVAGGLTVAVTNRSELSRVNLQREELIFATASANVGAKVAGVAMVFSGASYSTSMTTAAILSFALMNLHPQSRPRLPRAEGLFSSVKHAYSAPMLVYSLATVIVSRIAFIAVPHATTPARASSLATALAALQYIGTVLISGLQTLLAVRRGKGTDLGLDRLEKVYVFTGPFLALALLLVTPQAVPYFSNDGSFEAHWWILIALSLPLLIANRARQFSWLAINHDHRAVRQAIILAVTAILMVALAVILATPTLIAATWLVAESVGLASSMQVRQGRQKA